MEFFGAYFLVGIVVYLLVSGWVIGGKALVCLFNKKPFFFGSVIWDAILWPWSLVK